ncbi:MAG: TIGR01906 family membrane protein [Chloroflexi bacterium]|nr:TIGR01906 family membrane protein [Chloroflexota bacterium]
MLFVAAIPVIIISTSVRSLVLDPSFYESGQVRYGAARTTGLQQAQLQASNRALVSYFASSADDLAAELQRQGQSGILFNEREATHLSDVRGLVRGVFTLQLVALAYAVLFVVIGCALARSRFIIPLAHRALWGGVLTLIVLGVFAALSTVDFSQLFLVFHLVSFSNDLWILNPNTDYLIRMFPQAFFFDASVALAVNSAIGAMTLAIVTGAVVLMGKRMSKFQQA